MVAPGCLGLAMPGLSLWSLRARVVHCIGSSFEVSGAASRHAAAGGRPSRWGKHHRGRPGRGGANRLLLEAPMLCTASLLSGFGAWPSGRPSPWPGAGAGALSEPKKPPPLFSSFPLSLPLCSFRKLLVLLLAEGPLHHGAVGAPPSVPRCELRQNGACNRNLSTAQVHSRRAFSLHLHPSGPSAGCGRDCRCEPLPCPHRCSWGRWHFGDTRAVCRATLVNTGHGCPAAQGVTVRTESSEASFFLCAAKPLREPVVWQGPFALGLQTGLACAVELLLVMGTGRKKPQLRLCAVKSRNLSHFPTVSCRSHSLV